MAAKEEQEVAYFQKIYSSQRRSPIKIEIEEDEAYQLRKSQERDLKTSQIYKETIFEESPRNEAQSLFSRSNLEDGYGGDQE